MTTAAPLEIDLSNPDLYNSAYIPLFTCRKRYIVLYGGRDSGKSYTAAQLLVLRLLQERHCKVVLMRKVYADIRDSQYQTIVDVIDSWNLSHLFKCTTSPLRIRCVNGNEVIARGLDRPAKLKSVKDPTMVWVEEGDEITFHDFVKTDTSLRHSNPETLLQFMVSFNPESEEGWINERFFPSKNLYERDDGDFLEVESTDPNAIIYHTTYKNNRYCPPERGQLYENLKTQMGGSDNWFRVYCLGLWGNALEGLVFPDVVYRDEFPARDECKIYGVGLDFGFTNDPTAAILCALAHGEIWLQEITYKPGLVNRRNPAAPHVGSIESELRKAGIQAEAIIADSAEPKSIQDLRLCGFNIQGASKGKGSVEAGLNEMKRYRINVVNSPNLKKEFRSYSYAMDSDGKATNKPIDAWNHGIDAARYWFTTRVRTGGAGAMAIPGITN